MATPTRFTDLKHIMSYLTDNITHDIVIKPAPPSITDLCSVQAANEDPAAPILTIYRKRPSTAADWIAKTARDNRYDAYLLRDRGRWELSNVHGHTIDRGDSPLIIPVRESVTSVPVDRAALLQEACELTGDPNVSLLACLEGHAGASAADHSNFYVVCLRMISQADPADLEHVVLINSRKWPCPVTGVLANVAKLSPARQDFFLKRFKQLNNSCPLRVRDSLDILEHRLVRLRQDYVCDLLRRCGRVAGMPEDRINFIVTQWMLASTLLKYSFVRHIVKTLREGLIYQQYSAETFSPAIIEHRGAAVVEDYKKHLKI